MRSDLAEEEQYLIEYTYPQPILESGIITSTFIVHLIIYCSDYLLWNNNDVK